MGSEMRELPSLLTPGAGLFDTHVTWDDIQNNMQHSLGTAATFGDSKKVTNIGEGNGFLSKICLIEPDWQNPEREEALPIKFVAKMHNIELKVYELFVKYGLEEKMAMAEIYHCQEFTENEPDKGHFLMEYVEDLVSVHISDNLPVVALNQPLRSLASMAAASLRFTDDEKSYFKTKPFTEVFGNHFGESNIQMFTPALEKFGEGRLVSNIERLVLFWTWKNMTKYLNSWVSIIIYQVHSRMSKVLCHGDLWSTNVLWRNIEEKHKMAAIVDYQTAHFGSPSIDLCRFLITSLSGKDRREHSKQLLKTYYDYLLEELAGDEPPFGLEQLQESYDLCFPMAGYMVLPMFGSMEDILSKTANLEEREKLKQLIHEKADCLLEDILNYSEKNETE